ncbi:MAG: hypothetical protein P4L50_25735 [Anaerolineaceae bacterium]|nr:hypothetical protein [Anaerolineaceae bacterium]
MLKLIKPVFIGPILLIGLGVVLIIGVIIWQALLTRPRSSLSSPQSGPSPTLTIPRTNTANLASAYFQENGSLQPAQDYSPQYLDFSATHL